MMLTPEQFSRIQSIGLCLPQTSVGPGKAAVVGLVSMGSSDIIDVPWLCMHVTDTLGLIRYGNLVVATKTAGSPATVTASEAFFSATDVGSTLTWSDGTQTYITAYGSPTSVTVTNVAGVTNPATGTKSGYFTLQPSVPDIINTAEKSAVCGVVSLSPELFDLPGGYPESALTTDSVEVCVASPFNRRRYFGPGTLAVTVMNNTRNFELQVAANAVFRYTRGL